MTPARSFGWREVTLLALAAIPLAVLMLGVEPIPQDSGYHALADNRPLLGIPNFANVASNVAFLIVGALGLHLCLTRGASGASRSWLVFFIGAAAVAAGSAYYHWTPDDATLAWDRLADDDRLHGASCRAHVGTRAARPRTRAPARRARARRGERRVVALCR